MSIFRTARLFPLVAVAALSLTACGGGDDQSSPSTDTTMAAADASIDTSTDAESSNTIILSGSEFDQTELRVAVGTTVTWQNNDDFAHTVTSDDESSGAFDSGEFGAGETFEFTFDEAGEYSYFCEIHPTMQGVVIVE